MREDEGTIFRGKTKNPRPEVALVMVLRKDLRLHVLDSSGQIIKNGMHVDPIPKIIIVIGDVRCNHASSIIIVRYFMTMSTAPGVDETVRHAPYNPRFLGRPAE